MLARYTGYTGDGPASLSWPIGVMLSLAQVEYLKPKTLQISTVLAEAYQPITSSADSPNSCLFVWVVMKSDAISHSLSLASLSPSFLLHSSAVST